LSHPGRKGRIGPALAPLALVASVAGAEPLPIKDGQWQLEGPGVAIATQDGRDVIEVESGIAQRRDVALQDGTIEFDVQLTRRRSFVYVLFRMSDRREHEEFYLRPHKSGLPDALQYAPVYQGQSAWQLHHGPGATAAIEFDPGAWTHVRVVLEGRRAALFIGDMSKPALLVPRLAHEPRAGHIALRGFLPPGTPGQGPIARFANVSVQPGVIASPLPAPTGAATPPAGVVPAWSVSPAFVPKASDEASLPALGAPGAFRRIQAEPSGLVELHRFVPLPEGSRDAAAVARLQIRAEREGIYAFELGFSDEATVFVNGRPVFRGEASYSYDVPRREGLIGFDQARLWLPLKAGDNELAVLVSDSFGGWGLMGRFPDPRSLRVEAP
jgi:hypothetical protein